MDGGANDALVGTPVSAKSEFNLTERGGGNKEDRVMVDAKAAKRLREEELRANLLAWKRAAAASLEGEVPLARPVLQR